MRQFHAPLVPGVFYHVYNRGNNSEDIFIETKNFTYFLSLYTKYIEPIADTYAYCLLKNHFHLLVRIKDEEELYTTSAKPENGLNFRKIETLPSKQFSNLFNAYAKSINSGYNRTGSLFEENFGRIPITDNSYLAMIIFYLHFNPQKHGMTRDFRTWQWSSYKALVSSGATHLKRQEVLDFFGGIAPFEEFHRGMVNEKKISDFIDATLG